MLDWDYLIADAESSGELAEYRARRDQFRAGDHVRYSGDVTERPCDATVEEFVPGVPSKWLLRLKNGAAFLADPADIESEEQ